MNKRSNLLREYARLHDMCEGTTVDPDVCIKLNGTTNTISNLSFRDLDTVYEFAVAIVENTPIFANDILYYEYGGIFSTSTYINNPAFKWSLKPNLNKDEYIHLIQAQKEGKKLAWRSYWNGEWCAQEYKTNAQLYQYSADRWKVIEPDQSEEIYSSLFDGVFIKLTKSGLNGVVSAEVISSF